MRKNKVLVIIPAYNEEDNISKVVEQFCDRYSQYDYVVVNDGSSDDTRKICAKKGYNFLDLPINVGLAGAIRAGIKYANYHGYDYAVQIDGDGQHDPKYIKDMLEKMRSAQADIVIGSRFKEKKKPHSMRMLGSRIISGAIKLTTGGKKIEDVTSGMRLFNKRMIKNFGYNMHYSPEPDTIAYLLNCGIKIEEIQVEMYERIAGTSYLNLKNSVWYMLKMLFSILVFQWVRSREVK